MTASSEDVAKIEASLLEGASIRRVIGLQVATAGSDLVVGAKVDIEAELTMKAVSYTHLDVYKRQPHSIGFSGTASSMRRALPKEKRIYLH